MRNSGSSSRFLKVLTAGIVLLLSGAAGVATADYAVNWPEMLQNAGYVGSESCLDCHDDMDAAFATGRHGLAWGFDPTAPSDMGCESCHGPGSIHESSEEPADIVNPAKVDAALSSGICLDCHRTGEMSHFASTDHGLGDIACVSCHGVHGEQRTGLLRAAEPDLCYECHVDVKGKTYLPSHHPIEEGKMVCSDCHDQHNSSYRNVFTGERDTELCFSCHADKHGPFVFEHDPVIEDCGICHDPHGAVSNNLLKQNEPFLCLQCHQAHFHTQLMGIEGEFTSIEGYTGISTIDGAKRGMLTKCTRCHSEVHGSDFPSQSISGQGGAMTR